MLEYYFQRITYLASRLKPEMDGRREWLNEEVLKIDADAVAWTFSNIRRLPISRRRFIHPGIIVWIKEVERQALLFRDSFDMYCDASPFSLSLQHSNILQNVRMFISDMSHGLAFSNCDAYNLVYCLANGIQDYQNI